MGHDLATEHIDSMTFTKSLSPEKPTGSAAPRRWGRPGQLPAGARVTLVARAVCGREGEGLVWEEGIGSCVAGRDRVVCGREGEGRVWEGGGG